MATNVKDVVAVYQKLSSEWNKKKPNLVEIGEILTQLKIALTQLAFLPTEGDHPSKQELLLARDVLEIGAQWAIAKKDIKAFERYMAQLKTYYFDYKAELPESAYKHQLLGLNLLRLLAQNKLSEFHTELELLPAKELHANVYIKHPVAIEQYLMEGSYNKVFLARGNVPAESYNFFIDILLNTIRDDIAKCIEKAYDKLAFSEVARMLFFQTEKPMKAYAQQRKWKLGPDAFFHFKHEEKKTDEVIPSTDLVKDMINYARELEMIV